MTLYCTLIIPFDLLHPRVLLRNKRVIFAIEFSLIVILAAVQERLFILVFFSEVKLEASPLVCNKCRWFLPFLAAKPAGQLPHKLQTLPCASPRSVATFPLVQHSDWNETKAVEPIPHGLGPQFSGLVLPRGPIMFLISQDNSLTLS